MILVCIIVCNQGVDFVEIHKETYFPVGFSLCKNGTCIFEKGQDCDNPVFVHKGEFSDKVFFQVDRVGRLWL